MEGFGRVSPLSLILQHLSLQYTITLTSREACRHYNKRQARARQSVDLEAIALQSTLRHFIMAFALTIPFIDVPFSSHVRSTVYKPCVILECILIQCSRILRVHLSSRAQSRAMCLLLHLLLDFPFGSISANPYKLSRLWALVRNIKSVRDQAKPNITHLRSP